MKVENSRPNLELNDVAGLQTPLPLEVGPNCIATFEVNERLTRRIDFFQEVTAQSSAATTNILVSPTGKSFVLCGFCLSYIKTADCDNASGSVDIRIPFAGITTKVFIGLPLLTLTAQNDTVVVSLNRPIKCDVSGTLLLQTPTYTAGSFIRNVSVWGYFE